MKAPRSLQRGITFVESAAYLAVASVLLGSGLPALVEARSLGRLEAAADALRTDVQQARAAAVAMNQPVRLRTVAHAQGSCTVVHVGPVGSCTCSPDGASTCTAAGRSLGVTRYGQGEGVALAANVSTMSFDGEYGTVTPTGSFVLGGERQGQLKLVVNVTGRSRTCRLSGSLPAYPAC